MNGVIKNNDFNSLEKSSEEIDNSFKSKKDENFSSTEDLKEYLEYKYGKFGMSLFP